tara:strand:- start:15 stop:1067 length:1053 start_codon:yes stop_codon:yes gene_type:complete
MDQDIKRLTYNNLYPFLQKVKNKNYLLLGESTHGTEEYYALRLAITIIMIKDFGYNTVLFETDWSSGYQLNLYIHSKINKPIKAFFNDVFQKYPKWMANNEYIIQLVLFMKRWNEHHTKKVFFYGIDCQDIELAKENLCHEKTLNCSIVQQIIQNYSKMKHSSNYWNIRDTFWYHVIKMIQHHKKSKFILWAHNSHIGNVKANFHQPNKVNIGYLLDKTHKSFKIGCSTYQGSVKASKEWDSPGRKYILKKAHKDSFEHLCHELSISRKMSSFIYVCDPKIPMKHYFRYVGVIYNSENEMNAHYQLTNINKEYDIIVFIDTTSYLKQPTTIRDMSLAQYVSRSKRLLNKI